MLCIGPPKPSGKPAAQGTKHCQRNLPGLPVSNEKMTVVCASARVQGATLHWFFALSGTPLSGTETPRSGIANVCGARSGSSTLSVLPSTLIVPPVVPRAWPQNGSRKQLVEREGLLEVVARAKRERCELRPKVRTRRQD